MSTVKMAEVEEKLARYKKYLEKSLSKDVDTKDVSIVLRKLEKMDITLEHLQTTSIGKMVNSYRKHAGEVGERAKVLVSKWKSLVPVLTCETVDQTVKPDRARVPYMRPSKVEIHRDSVESRGDEEPANCPSKDTDSLRTHVKQERLSAEPGYSKSRDGSSSKTDKGSSSRDKHSRHKDKYSSEDRHSSSSKDKYSSEDKHSSSQSKDKYSSSKNKHRGDSREKSSIKTESSSKQQSKSDKINGSSKHKSHKNDKHSSKDYHKKDKMKELRITNDTKIKQEESRDDSPSPYRDELYAEERDEASLMNDELFQDLEDLGELDEDVSVADAAESPSSSQKQIQQSTDDHKHKKRKPDESTSSSSSKKAKSEPEKKVVENEGFSLEDLMQIDSLKMKKHLKKKPKQDSSSHVTSSSHVSKSSTHKPDKKRVAHKSSSSESKHKSRESHHKSHKDPKQHASRESSSSSKSHKSSSKSSSREERSSGVKRGPADMLDIPAPSKQLKLSAADIVSSLPETTPNYHPLPYLSRDDADRAPKEFCDDTLLSKKNTRTAVYSGRKMTTYLTAVPTLYDACMRVLMDNIDNLESVGGVPCEILKPVLDKCSPSQLYTLEEYNPHFVGETEDIWEKLCRKDFKTSTPDEFESWRELYLRKHDEREAKLKKLTANITLSTMKKTEPVKKTKLAFVDAVAKPPRGVRRQQLRHGTAGPQSKGQDPLSRLSSHGGAKAQPRAPIVRSQPAALSASPVHVVPQGRKAKVVAPMMAKTMRMMKKMR